MKILELNNSISDIFQKSTGYNWQNTTEKE